MKTALPLMPQRLADAYGVPLSAVLQDVALRGVSGEEPVAAGRA